MLKVTKNKDITKLTVNVAGRVDALSASTLTDEIKPALDGIEVLVINLKEMEYISSAGIRVLLQLQKTMMEKKGRMSLTGMNDEIFKIFKDTGMTNVFNILK